MCTRVLKELGVTAVLNSAQGTMTDWNYVNTKVMAVAKACLGSPIMSTYEGHFNECTALYSQEAYYVGTAVKR